MRGTGRQILFRINKKLKGYLRRYFWFYTINYTLRRMPALIAPVIKSSPLTVKAESSPLPALNALFYLIHLEKATCRHTATSCWAQVDPWTDLSSSITFLSASSGHKLYMRGSISIPRHAGFWSLLLLENETVRWVPLFPLATIAPDVNQVSLFQRRTSRGHSNF